MNVFCGIGCHWEIVDLSSVSPGFTLRCNMYNLYKKSYSFAQNVGINIMIGSYPVDGCP